MYIFVPKSWVGRMVCVPGGFGARFHGFAFRKRHLKPFSNSGQRFVNHLNGRRRKIRPESARKAPQVRRRSFSSCVYFRPGASGALSQSARRIDPHHALIGRWPMSWPKGVARNFMHVFREGEPFFHPGDNTKSLSSIPRAKKIYFMATLIS